MLKNQRARVVFTDPPFNVRVNGRIRTDTGSFDESTEASGEVYAAEFTEFLNTTFGNASSGLMPGGLIYAFMDWRHVAEIQRALADLGLEMINLCIWLKPNGGMGSFYRSRHELVLVGKKPGASHTNNLDLGKPRSQSE